MGTAVFQRGTVVRIDGLDYRLMRQVSNVWQLEHIKTGRIINHEHRELLQLLVDQKLVFVISDTVSPGSLVIDIPPEQLELAKVRLMYVRAVLGLPMTREKLEPAIVEIWNKCVQPKHKPGWTTVYRWAKRYLEGGRDFRALVDNSSRKGNRTNRFPKEVMEICNQSIEEVFLTPERPTIQATSNHAILRVRHENQQRTPSTTLPEPTPRLIRRLASEIPEFDKHAARYGRDAAVRTFRSVMGRRTTGAPLERAQIDHTVFDCVVVDDDTCLPLGRPYLTFCIDDFTRCVLGLYIGFGGPSCLSISRCLKDAFLPKLRLKEQFPEIKCEWPAYGVMGELLMDHGLEFHSDALQQMCFSLGIVICFSPRRQPWFKGKIERFFRTVNDDLAHTIPGTTFSNIFERGEYDPAKHAQMRVSTARKALRKMGMRCVPPEAA